MVSRSGVGRSKVCQSDRNTESIALTNKEEFGRAGGPVRSKFIPMMIRFLVFLATYSPTCAQGLDLKVLREIDVLIEEGVMVRE